MTAQPVEQPAPLPRIPRTIKGIRRHLPLAAQALFDEEIADLNLDDLTAVARLRDKWWGRAMYETNPQAQEDFAKLARGELELVPSPFAR